LLILNAHKLVHKIIFYYSFIMDSGNQEVMTPVIGGHTLTSEVGLFPATDDAIDVDTMGERQGANVMMSENE
jgi:hypothetical protein